ncbi:MAG: hypothetical protein FWD28_05630 [Treponema sp.]|nr:hypothetical protein [Treponema sp.]
MQYEISCGFAFYGFIPDGSNEQHLGVVLGVNDLILKYCYCTSKNKYKYLHFNEIDFIRVPVSLMEKYFYNPQETYIFLSQRHIIDMYLVTFNGRISSSEYDVKGQIDNDIIIAIFNKIKNSENLSERFKNDFFSFVE